MLATSCVLLTAFSGETRSQGICRCGGNEMTEIKSYALGQYGSQSPCAPLCRAPSLTLHFHLGPKALASQTTQRSVWVLVVLVTATVGIWGGEVGEWAQHDQGSAEDQWG